MRVTQLPEKVARIELVFKIRARWEESHVTQTDSPR